MIGNGNNRMNNIINRRPQQYPEINELDKMEDPKSKFYQNAFNMNKNIPSTNNSMNKQNIIMNRNMNINLNKNNMNNLNKMNMNKNIMNINKNSNIQMRNARNINNQIQNGNINKALMVLRNEFKKKDDRIKALELKVADLENKINMITQSGTYQLSENNNNNNNSNNNISNVIALARKKMGKNFTFSEKYSEEINPNFNNKRDNSLNKTPEINYGRNNNPFRSNDNQNMNNNFYTQTKSANQYKIKQNNNINNINNINNMNDNEYILPNKNNNLNNNSNDAQADGSTFTGNSSNFQRHSKNEVKIFLKEVKAKVDPLIFREFIQNIKLLTNTKENNNGIDKNTVIEKVRILFGDQFKDLFIRFESIIGN